MTARLVGSSRRRCRYQDNTVLCPGIGIFIVLLQDIYRFYRFSEHPNEYTVFPECFFNIQNGIKI